MADQGKFLESQEALRFRIQRLLMRKFAGVPLVAGSIGKDYQNAWETTQRAAKFDSWFSKYSFTDAEAMWQQFSEGAPEVQEQLVNNWYSEMEQSVIVAQTT